MRIKKSLMRFLGKIFSRRVLHLTPMGYSRFNTRQLQQSPLFYELPLEIWDRILFHIDPHEHGELFHAAPLLAVRFHHYSTQAYKLCFRYHFLALPITIQFKNMSEPKLLSLACRVIRQFDGSQLRRLVNWATINRHPETIRLLLAAGLSPLEHMQYPLAVSRLHTRNIDRFDWIEPLIGHYRSADSFEYGINMDGCDYINHISHINLTNINTILRLFESGTVAQPASNVTVADTLSDDQRDRLAEYWPNSCIKHRGHHNFIEFSRLKTGFWNIGVVGTIRDSACSDLIMSKNVTAIGEFLRKQPFRKALLEAELDRLTSQGKLNKWDSARIHRKLLGGSDSRRNKRRRWHDVS
jgi:hypothetical protein